MLGKSSKGRKMAQRMRRTQTAPRIIKAHPHPGFRLHHDSRLDCQQTIGKSRRVRTRRWSRIRLGCWSWRQRASPQLGFGDSSQISSRKALLSTALLLRLIFGPGSPLCHVHGSLVRGGPCECAATAPSRRHTVNVLLSCWTTMMDGCQNVVDDGIDKCFRMVGTLKRDC